MSYFNIHLSFETKLPGWRHMLVIERGRKWTTLYYPVTGERVKLLNETFDKAPKEPAKHRKGWKGDLIRRVRHSAEVSGENTEVFKEAFKKALRLAQAA